MPVLVSQNTSSGSWFRFDARVPDDFAPLLHRGFQKRREFFRCATIQRDMIAWFGGRGIYYGWVIVAVMFVTLFISLGFRFAFGVFYSAILDETGWRGAGTAGGGFAPHH